MTIRPKASGKFVNEDEITVEIEKIKFCMKCYSCVINIPITSENIDGGRTIASTDLTFGCYCGDEEHMVTKEGSEALELLKYTQVVNTSFHPAARF